MTTVEAWLHEAPFAELAARHEVTREQLTAFFDALDAPMATISQGEADFLDENAGLSDRVKRRLDETSDDARALLTQVHLRTSARLRDGSWDAKDVQRHLGKSHSTLSRWHASGRVYAFETESGRRYPRWQFVSTARGALGPLPGLAVVLAARPDGVAPLAFEGFMTHANPGLEGARPLDVLAQHGDVERVAQLVVGEWGRGR